MSQYGFSTEGETIVSDFHSQVQGRTFLITGPSEGIVGASTAITLAHGSPALILLLGRSLPKIQPTLDTIHATSPSTTVKFIAVSLDSLTSVRTAANTILTDPTIPNIDVIINNAGIMACPYRATEDGLEHQFTTNYLSHFLLTNLLMPKILASSHPRIINVSSAAHLTSDIRYSDPGFSEGKTYHPIFAYAQSKTANILFSVELNKRLGGKGLSSFALHPGAVDTGLAQYFTKEMIVQGLAMWEKMGKVKPLRKSLGQACSTTLRAALDPGLVVEGRGVYLEDCQVTTAREVVAAYALDEENAARCWRLAEEMVGGKFEY